MAALTKPKKDDPPKASKPKSSKTEGTTVAK